MQCARPTVRSVCAAHNAFNPALAIRAAFGTTSPCYQEEEQQQRTLFRRYTSVNAASVNVANKTEATDHDHDQFLLKCVNAMRKYHQWQWVRDTLGKEQWAKHMRLVREMSARLATKDGKAALDRLNAKEQHTILRGIDYVPKVIAPELPETPSSVPPPWSVPPDRRGYIQRGRVFFDVELRRFSKYISLSPLEQVAREAVAREIVRYLKDKVNSKTGVELFGSAKTGLASPLSDIDVRLWDKLDDTTNPNYRRLANRMEFLTRNLIRNPSFGVVHFRNGRYPIINCQHVESGIKIQIVAGTGAVPQQAVVAKYLESIPFLREAFAVIRTFFEMRGFNDVYSGGIGSYGQFVMLLAALNRNHSHQRKKDPNVVDHVMKFLSFYNILDSTKRGVAVSPRSIFLKHDHHPTLDRFHYAAKRRGDDVRAGQWRICTRQEFEHTVLCIQDPATPNNDLGRKASATKHILLTIQNARSRLKTVLERTDQLRDGESILEILVGRCDEVYRGARNKIQHYGEKVAKEKWEKMEQDVRDRAAVSVKRADYEVAESEREDLLEQMEAEMEHSDERSTSEQTKATAEEGASTSGNFDKQLRVSSADVS